MTWKRDVDNSTRCISSYQNVRASQRVYSSQGNSDGEAAMVGDTRMCVVTTAPALRSQNPEIWLKRPQMQRQTKQATCAITLTWLSRRIASVFEYV